MADRPHKILVVEPDADILEMIVETLARRLNPRITCVATAEACLDVELSEPHDLVITESALGEESGLVLAEHLLSLSARPVILLADDPTCEQVLAAMRVGLHDLLPKPFPIEELLDTAQRALRHQEMSKARSAKQHRLRELVRHVIRERRDLDRRVELVCRDLVGAHRRLVHRVLEAGVAPAH